MELDDKFYFTIGEVAEKLDLPASQLRYWSGEFQLNIRKNRKGDRLYQREDIDTLKRIKHLLKDQGYTIEGAKRVLREGVSTPPINTQSNADEVYQRLLDIKRGLIELLEIL